MTLKSDIDQLAADAALMHQVVHGDQNTTVMTQGGPVRSVTKLINDKNMEINVAAGGILAQSTAQANAAGGSAGQASAAAQQALNAAGTTQQYTTALAAIASQTAIVPAATKLGFNGSIVANCIDDTKRWSDGGAARKRCQNTSWYNETTTATGVWRGFVANEAAARAIAGATTGDYFFNTTDKNFYSLNAGAGVTQVYRGSRKDYPEVIGWTVESGRVIGWDLTDPTSPMWMVFVGSSQVSALFGAGACSISAMNGIIFVCFANGGAFRKINFIADRFDAIATVLYMGYTVAQRNAGLSSWASTNNSISLVSPTVNSVAAIALPTSPIDPSTGLPTLTIAVGTAGGVSVIKDDGTVVNSASNVSSNSTVFFNGSLYWTYGNNRLRCPISALNSAFAQFSAISPALLPGNSFSNASGIVQVPFALSSLAKVGIPAAGSVSGAIITKDGGSANDTLISTITNAYNSGWQNGDIRGAWLSDTVAETVSGSELIPLGQFINSSDISIWSNNLGNTVSWVAGTLDTISSSVSNEIGGISLTCVIGKTYRLSYTRGIASGLLYNSAGAAFAAATMPDIVGNNVFIFTATATNVSINWRGAGALSHATFDNLSVVECAADRSIKANPLTVIGSLTKSAVAAGAQLMYWSGFSAANYLEQPYSANLDFATDFNIAVWINPTAAAQNGTILTRTALALSGNSWELDLVSGVVTLGRSIAGAAYADTSFGYTPPINTPTLLELVKTGGVLYLYANGKQQATTIADANSYSNTAAVLDVGIDYARTTPFVGSIALLRASATAPSADQSAFRYDTERRLFEPGAQCCIAGSSSSVTALDYDDATDLLSVATSYGVTEFQGLKAVNSYATTIGAPSSISTKGGYKLLGGASGASFYRPSQLLVEELARTAEQRKYFGSTLIPQEFDAVAGQTAFVLPMGINPQFVYSAGALKRFGETKDYSISFNGFRYTVNFAVAPGAAVWVSILCNRS